MAVNSDSDDDVWYNQDEDRILQNLQCTVESKNESENTEYIKCHISAADEYLKQLRIDVGACASATNVAHGASKSFSASELRRISEMPQSLDMFLYMLTEIHRDIFAEQLSLNDNQQHVLLYVKILQDICKLELPGFEQMLLSSFAMQTKLMDHLKRILAKLHSPTLKGVWDADAKLLLEAIRYLLLRAYKFGVLTNKGIEVLSLWHTLLKQCENKNIIENTFCKELTQELTEIIINNTKADYKESEIYPTIEELQTNAIDNHSIYKPDNHTNIKEYISIQRQLLREDFMMPLREFVSKLQNKSSVKEIIEQGLLFENVYITLNPQYELAQRHGLVFMDLIGAERAQINDVTLKQTKPQRLFLNALKTGALLCFTSSYDFTDLILAVTTYTDKKVLEEKFIGIEIVRQYNIGNIYDKPLLMFQTPAFFPPYHHVFNYLNKCYEQKYFPMDNYIIYGEIKTKPPEYYHTKAKYIYNNEPLHSKEIFDFNSEQTSAFLAALNNELCLIQGPPGTGKTHLSVELVKTLIQNLNWIGGPIVIVTYTNDSLDKFLLKLSKHTQSIARLGNQRCFPEIGKFYINNIEDISDKTPRLKRLNWTINAEYKEQFNKLQTLYKEFDGSDEVYQKIVAAQKELRAKAKKLNTVRIITQYYAAKDKAVIAMTTTCAAKMNFMFHLLKNKIVFFEEAAEILESHTIACLSPYVKHVIMVGDHKQLQPCTSSFKLNRANGLNISLFERLIRQNFKLNILHTQYRMRRQIADLLTPTIYEKLISDKLVDEYPNVRNMSKNLYLLTHESKEKKLCNFSYLNEFEAEKLFTLAIHLLTVSNYEPDDIIVLSPYLEQVEQIKCLFAKNPFTASIGVVTVDRFQGLEANIVLLSLVRSNLENNIGFLMHTNRICVTLSRGKWALYMTGNMKVLAKVSKTWHAIKLQLEAQDCMGTEFPYVKNRT